MKNFLLISFFLFFLPYLASSSDQIEEELDEEALECLLIFDQEFIFECEGDSEKLEK